MKPDSHDIVAAFICGLRLQTFSQEFRLLQVTSRVVSLANLEKRLTWHRASRAVPEKCHLNLLNSRKPSKKKVIPWQQQQIKNARWINVKLLSYLSSVDLSSSLRRILKALLKKNWYSERNLKWESASEGFGDCGGVRRWQMMICFNL